MDELDEGLVRELFRNAGNTVVEVLGVDLDVGLTLAGVVGWGKMQMRRSLWSLGENNELIRSTKHLRKIMSRIGAAMLTGRDKF